jgi:hypothetical protein
MVDWVTVVPVAAVVSAVVTLSIRWLDRPRAVLRLEAGARASGESSGGLVAVWCSLMNFGDGDVYDLRVFGSGCHAAVPAGESAGDTLWTYRLTRLKAGESVPIQVTLKPYTGADDDQRAVIVTYSLRPWRSLRRTKRYVLVKTPVPSWLPPIIFEPAEIPWWVRRTRSLERRSPAAQLYLNPREADLRIGTPDQSDDASGAPPANST